MPKYSKFLKSIKKDSFSVDKLPRIHQQLENAWGQQPALGVA
jgi:hypothetical protein